MEIRHIQPRIGTRKLHYLLKGKISVGRDKLFEILRERDLLVKKVKSYTKTTNSKHWLKKHPNLYRDMKATKPEEVFVSDITYLKTKEKTYYLSLVTDAYSRKIMGYKLSSSMDSQNVVQALDMAIKQRKYYWQSVHHSDRGLQYASAIYQERLKSYGIKPSMTDGYDCYQNALAERVNGILKNEFLFDECENFDNLEVLVSESINIYNSKRPHLSLGYQTPDFIHNTPVSCNLQEYLLI